jgi:dienelactone hydrolase
MRALLTVSAIVSTLLLSSFASPASAEVQGREVEYKAGDTVLLGYLAWNDSFKGKRPGVLVIHEWWGHNWHARNQALRLAKDGYVALALDMFGKGKLAHHPKDAQGFVAETTKDPAIAVARFDAAADLLRQQPQVNPDKIGAIGYCFGGAVALNMARAGKNLQAVATFHGALSTMNPAQPGAVKPRILVLTGADDGFVPPDQVEKFKAEMKAAGAKAEVIVYPGAKHSFTNPDADKYGIDQVKYNAAVDAKSWAAMLKMFRTALK